VPGALTTVVGFGRVSALSTRLAASLLRTKTARIVNQQESSSAAAMARDKWLVTKFVPNRHVERWNPSQNAETAHCLAQSQSSDGRKQRQCSGDCTVSHILDLCRRLASTVKVPGAGSFSASTVPGPPQ
jgi:hypothetical protein